MSARTASVVICAYTEDRWEQLREAVASVQDQRRPVQQIIVVIDHHDALLAQAAATFDGVTVLANAHQQGLSGARNTGIAASTAEVVCFLDDDATAEAEWSSRLLDPYADPNVLGVGGAAVPVWESGRPAWWPAEFGWVVGCSYPGQPTRTAPVRNLMGCSMSIRRDVLQAVGGFDPALGRQGDNQSGCEETELCIRARRLFPDGVFLHEPAAVVHHRVPAARATWPYFRARCRAEGASKARMSGTVGRSAALSSETMYVRRVLPAGVATEVGALLGGDLSAGARAMAIVAGLGYTAGSFLTSRRVARRPAPSAVEPVLPLVIDLERPLAPIDARRADETGSYRRALCLLTRDGTPVDKIEIALDDEVVSPELVGERLRDGLDAPAGPLLPTSDGPSVAPFPPMAGTDATVVIATRERPERLAECLRTVFASSLSPARVVVVDNAPTTARTADLVAALASEEPRLRYVREDRPGLARAHNAALPHVQTTLVAFTDDDVLVEPGWLAALVGGFDDEHTVCVTGLIAPRELDTVAQQWVEGNVTYAKGLRRQVFDADAHHPDDPLFPLTAGVLGSGANMAFRTDYLRRRHGFDAALGTGTLAQGGDDLAAFYDVIADGYRLVYEPAAIVRHLHYRDYESLRRQTYGYGAGLGAHLTRCLLTDPRRAVVLLLHATVALRRARAIVQPATVSGLPSYPSDLSRQQLRGLLSGPWRYLRSRRRSRREVS